MDGFSFFFLANFFDSAVLNRSGEIKHPSSSSLMFLINEMAHIIYAAFGDCFDDSENLSDGAGVADWFLPGKGQSSNKNSLCPVYWKVWHNSF